MVIFESKRWKLSGILAFVAMNISVSALTIALVVVIFTIDSKAELEAIAGHTFSLKRIQNWLVGIAGITILVDAVAAISSMVKNRSFRIIISVLVSLTIAMVISIAVWGFADGDGRKEYFQETWNRMDRSTKYAFQTYFSCCGFETIAEWQTGVLPVNSSCYATLPDTNTTVPWLDGCYDRITSSYLDAITVEFGNTVATLSEEKVNPFYVGFISVFAIIAVAQMAVLFMFIISMCSAPSSKPNASQRREITVQNIHATSEQYTENGNGTAANDYGDVAVDHGTNKTCGTGLTDAIAGGLSLAFYWLGVRVGSRPRTTILLSLATVASLSVGLLQRFEPPFGSSGFLSEESKVIKETGLLRSTFYIPQLDQFILVVDNSDVLSADSFKTALDIDRSVKNVTTFSSTCLKIGYDCKQRSLFELWAFNDTVLNSLTKSDILEKVNLKNLTSPIFGDTYDTTQVIGGLVKNSSGQVISAKASLLHYFTNRPNEELENAIVSIGRRQYSGVDVYVSASSSRRQEASGTFTGDLPLFFVGFAFIFIYILLMTGKLSLLEHRIYIALLGCVSAGLSMSAGIGLTSCFGLPWTNIHLVVPFLVIGIGVDDMFVILQAWDTVNDDINCKHLPLAEKAGKTLQSAGVSITVTSMTDLVAFAVGATSELGAFSSFSVYVAMCIVLLFVLECTFFLACVVIDEQRKENRYDACLACCYEHDEDYKPSKCSQRLIVHRLFEDGIGRIVSNIPFAIFAICLSLGVAGLMSWGFYKLEVRYDPDWYIPSDSYLIDYQDKFEEFFSYGTEASVYVVNADFYKERRKLDALFKSLRGNPNLNSNHATSWFDAYISWKKTANFTIDVFDDSGYGSPEVFYADVRRFLMSLSGRNYFYDVVYRNGTIIGSKFDIRHRDTTNQVENVDIIASIREICETAGFGGEASVFPFGGLYYVYEITRIVRQEVYRNIGITMLCVLLMVIPMLASLQMGFWVALCVAMTTVEVAGTMYFADLSIEASTIITLLLSIGLAVDYAAHIGHKFLALKGTRKMRARVAMGQIGLAVFNGGFSTFLALSMLSLSELYTYRVFFTIFVCVVGYGLWNGLIFLPCVLAIVGPPPHANAAEARLSSHHDEKKNNVIANEDAMTGL